MAVPGSLQILGLDFKGQFVWDKERYHLCKHSLITEVEQEELRPEGRRLLQGACRGVLSKNPFCLPEEKIEGERMVTECLTNCSQLSCIYSALILHNDEVMVTDDKIKALIKAADVNVEPFCPGLFAKALANVNIGSLTCDIGTAEEKKVEAKKEESEESDDDVGFGLFD
ncbi:hypothetical protein CB1_000418029 [Camelus ferus]|nr:hypothetical protein CB1_000418029 [Camelus ferus]